MHARNHKGLSTQRPGQGRAGQCNTQVLRKVSHLLALPYSRPLSWLVLETDYHALYGHHLSWIPGFSLMDQHVGNPKATQK